MQENVNLVKALEIWTSGESISDFYINGIKILWIGRAGKFIAFISALTIVIDIIGVDKVKEFGESTRNLISARFVTTALPEYIWARYRRLILWLKYHLFTIRRLSIWGPEDAFYAAFSGVISGMISALSVNWLPYSWFGNLLTAVPLTLISISLLSIILFLASPGILGMMLILPALMILLIDALIEIVAFLLVKDQRVKIVALFFLVSGFLLDFLAS